MVKLHYFICSEHVAKAHLLKKNKRTNKQDKKHAQCGWGHILHQKCFDIIEILWSEKDEPNV